MNLSSTNLSSSYPRGFTAIEWQGDATFGVDGDGNVDYSVIVLQAGDYALRLSTRVESDGGMSELVFDAYLNGSRMGGADRLALNAGAPMNGAEASAQHVFKFTLEEVGELKLLTRLKGAGLDSMYLVELTDA